MSLKMELGEGNLLEAKPSYANRPKLESPVPMKWSCQQCGSRGLKQLSSRRCLKLPLVPGLEKAVRKLQAEAAQAVWTGKKF